MKRAFTILSVFFAASSSLSLFVFASGYSSYASSPLDYVMTSLIVGALLYVLPLTMFRFWIIQKPLSKSTSFWVSIGWLFLVHTINGLITISITGESPEGDFKIGVLWMLLLPYILSKGYKGPEPKQLTLKHLNRREILQFLRSTKNLNEEELKLLESFESMGKQIEFMHVDPDINNRKTNQERTKIFEDAIFKLVCGDQFKKILKQAEYDKHYVTNICPAVFQDEPLVKRADQPTPSAWSDEQVPPPQNPCVLQKIQNPISKSIEDIPTESNFSAPVSEPSAIDAQVSVADFAANKAALANGYESNADTDSEKHIDAHANRQADTPANNEDRLWCRICGTRLESDNIFCHKCGTRVIR